MNLLEIIYFSEKWLKDPQNWNRLMDALHKNGLEDVFNTSLNEVNSVFNDILKGRYNLIKQDKES